MSSTNDAFHKVHPVVEEKLVVENFACLPARGTSRTRGNLT